ncbi:hypothetical protein AMTRI_Chr03g143000 [Amborella trichopoda]
MFLILLLKVLALLSHNYLPQEMDLRNRWRKDLNAFGPNLPVLEQPSCGRKTIDLRFPSLSCS